MFLCLIAGLGFSKTEVLRRLWGNSFLFRYVTVKCIRKIYVCPLQKNNSDSRLCEGNTYIAIEEQIASVDVAHNNTFC